MSDDRKRLRLPGKVAWSTLSIALALAGAGCGDDSGGSDASARDATAIDAPGRDSGDTDAAGADALADSGTVLFCIPGDEDTGMPFDAATCGTVVSDPADCPPGCRAVG